MSLLRSLALSIGDPALSSRWLASIDGMNAPELVVEAINPGLTTIGSTQRFYAGLMQDFPDTANVPAISITFFETDDYKVTAWLRDWLNLIYDPETEVWGLPIQYKKRMEVRLYRGDSNTPSAAFELLQVWPTTPAPFDFSYANAEGRVTVTAEFQVAFSKFWRL